MMTEPTRDDGTLAAALDYARRGWRVLPITPGKKHPPIPAWQDAATTDAEMITSWFTGLYRGHGVGIATGAASGIWVLDVDDFDALRDLERRHAELPETLTSITGSGGYHLIFAWPGDGRVIRNNAGTRLGAGLDVRGDGGQIVAPPSVHPNGQAYEWDQGQGDEPVPAPEWLLELVCDRKPAQPQPRPRVEVEGDRPGDRWAAETDWADILTPRGWTLHHVDRRTGERHWTRPGKDPREGSSATTGFTDRDTLKVFTSSVPELEPEGVYTKLGFLAAMDHGGDHAAAARALAAAGWGAPPVDLDIVDPLVARAAPEATGGEEEAPGVGGWEFVDLGPILDGSYTPPVPTIGRRSDGAALIYPGRVHSIAGEPGGGKTWLALHVLAETIREGGVGALIDYEDTPMATVHRLRLLGLDDELIRTRFRYVRPDGPLVTRGGKVAAGTVAALEALGADVVVIDSVGESLAVEGLPPNDDDAVAQWFRRLPRMLARSGAAVIGIDHVTKDRDNRGLWAIGSQRKLAAIDGAAYGVEVSVAPTKTRDGKLKVTCAKDRHGTYQRGHLVAHVAVNNVAEGVEVLIEAPEERFRPTFYMEQVSRFLEDIPCASGRGVQRGVQGKTDTIRLALECLVDEKPLRGTDQ